MGTNVMKQIGKDRMEGSALLLSVLCIILTVTRPVEDCL